MANTPLQDRPGDLMPEDNWHRSFGRFLRAKRIDMGIDLTAVAEETKIGIDILQRIEQEDHARLPADVYVKGFLKSYSDMVGADSELLFHRYLISKRKFELGRFSEDAFFHLSRSKFRPKVIISLCAIIGIIVLSILAITLFHDDDLPAVAKKEVDAATAGPKAELPAPKSPDETNGQAVEPMILIIDALDETWVKVITDGKQPKGYDLKPEDRLQLRGESTFNLLIGNAGAVKLKLDGKPVSVPGKSGQLVTLQIP
jgi:hypothetical protein